MDQENEITEKFNFAKFIQNNKIKLSIIFVFFILVIFGLIILNEFKKNKILSISEKFNKAKILIENDRKVEALNDLIFIIDKKVLFYSPSALN